MKWMTKAFTWCTEKLPPVWGLMWMMIITGASLTMVVMVLKWLFHTALSF